MSKQLQDAYIVAASRTPIGKAPRGVFKNTRPDELLVHAIRSAVAQVPGLDTKRDRRRDRRLRDSRSGAGLERRAHGRAAGRPAEHGRRRDGEPLLRIGR